MIIPKKLVIDIDRIPSKNPPRVSVVLLSHNRPQYLSEAISSILNQTITDWELIIIDDFSTDILVDEVLFDAVKDGRIRVFKANYDVDNISLLWNKGLDISTGRYIALLDDDNKKKPTFCEEMSNYLDNHPEKDAVSCFSETISDAPGKSRTLSDLAKNAKKETILKGNCIDSGNLMFRRTMITEIGWFDERLRTEDDWDYVIRLLYESKGIGLVEKYLSEYRIHSENRINRSFSLGFFEHRKFITKEKKYGKKVRILLFHQDVEKITLSQNNVLRGIKNALAVIPWVLCDSLGVKGVGKVGVGYDFVFVFMPFSIDVSHIRSVKSKGTKLITYQCEDPQALGVNLQRVDLVDYVFTNEISVVEEYEKFVGKGRCGFCPSVSVDDISLVFRDNVQKKYDVIFYGYAYDSRVKFVKELIANYKKGAVAIVGGGWQGKNISADCLGELSEQDSICIMEESKIIILHNRCHTDLGGGPHSTIPKSVVRGYFECASGALIMLNGNRPHHYFNGEVIFYSDISDLITKINFYLDNEKLREEIGRKAKERALKDFTYKKRITNLLNGVRSMRYYHEVK